MKIFLSYALQDAPEARALANGLLQCGVDVVNSPDAILPGENLAKRTGEALEDADGIVVLLSPEAAKSDWVRHDIQYALVNERFQGKVVPLVVKHMTMSLIPWILGRFPVIHRLKNPAQNARQIVAYMKHRRGAPARVPAV